MSDEEILKRLNDIQDFIGGNLLSPWIDENGNDLARADVRLIIHGVGIDLNRVIFELKKRIESTKNE